MQLCSLNRMYITSQDDLQVIGFISHSPGWAAACAPPAAPAHPCAGTATATCREGKHTDVCSSIGIEREHAARQDASICAHCGQARVAPTATEGREFILAWSLLRITPYQPEVVQELPVVEAVVVRRVALRVVGGRQHGGLVAVDGIVPGGRGESLQE